MAGSMLTQQTPKKKFPVLRNNNVLESVRGVGSSVGATLTRDVVGKIGSDALQSILGGRITGGELKPNQPVNFQKEQEATPAPRFAPEMRPAVRVSSEDHEVRQKIDAIRQELAALSQSVKNLHQEIQSAVMETPVNPGIYHMNFYEQLRTFLRALREQIDDSRVWLSAFHSRKKKQGYWGMYKKHGTTFGLSSERNLATQAG